MSPEVSSVFFDEPYNVAIDKISNFHDLYESIVPYIESIKNQHLADSLK